MTSAQVKPVPDGMHTLTPHLVCDAVLAQAVSDMYLSHDEMVQAMARMGGQ